MSSRKNSKRKAEKKAISLVQQRKIEQRETMAMVMKRLGKIPDSVDPIFGTDGGFSEFRDFLFSSRIPLFEQQEILNIVY